MAFIKRSLILLAATSLFSRAVIATPDEIDDDILLPDFGLSPPPRTRPLHAGDAATGLCSDVNCLAGSAALDPDTKICVCPKWLDQNPKDPCGFLKCSETTEVLYVATSNQCICKVKHLTPVLINQATKEVPQKDADIYSVQPFFGEGIISFFVQLRGAPGGFNLNASTTIVAEGLEANTELVVVPANIKTKVLAAAENTALITAITFTADNKIDYYVTLNNGSQLKLFGDKMVHDIDLIDPAKPPSLSLTTKKARNPTKRDGTRMVAARGIEMISSGKIVADVGSCGLLKCTLDGQPARFNQFHNACYCKIPESMEHQRRDFTDTSALENCQMALACQPPSQAYLHEASRQCACVIWREGVSRPVIVSDSQIVRRAMIPEPPTEPPSLPLKSANFMDLDGITRAPDYKLDCGDRHALLQQCLGKPHAYHCVGRSVKGVVKNQLCKRHCRCVRDRSLQISTLENRDTIEPGIDPDNDPDNAIIEDATTDSAKGLFSRPPKLAEFDINCPGFPLWEPWCQKQPRKYVCEGPHMLRKGSIESQPCEHLCKCQQKGLWMVECPGFPLFEPYCQDLPYAYQCTEKGDLIRGRRERQQCAKLCRCVKKVVGEAIGEKK